MNKEVNKLVIEFKSTYKDFCESMDAKDFTSAIRHSMTLSGISSSIRTLNALFDLDRDSLVAKSEDVISSNVIPRLIKFRQKS